MFRNTGANAFAKIQMRLAYEDKRDLYCSDAFRDESSTADQVATAGEKLLLCYMVGNNLNILRYRKF